MTTEESLRSELAQAQLELMSLRTKLATLAKRSGELERSANLVAAQAIELGRQLRGGSMEHLRTAP